MTEGDAVSDPADPTDDDATAHDEERVDIDDPFEVPEQVEQAWDSEHVAEGEAPSG